ncbi:thiaminase II [soil metagenome]
MNSPEPDGLSGRLREVISVEVESWLDLPMLSGISAGTLDPALFRNYLEQDYLYLRHYARLYSWLAATAPDDQLEYYVSLAHGVIAVELDHHKRAAVPFGCDFSAIVPSVETQEYLSFYDSLAPTPAELVVAMTPCIFGYGIALDELRLHASGLYRDWIDIYTGADYAELVARHFQMVDGAVLAEDRALEITARALELERRFWNQVPAAPGASSNPITASVEA